MRLLLKITQGKASIESSTSPKTKSLIQLICENSISLADSLDEISLTKKEATQYTQEKGRDLRYLGGDCTKTYKAMRSSTKIANNMRLKVTITEDHSLPV